MKLLRGLKFIVVITAGTFAVLVGLVVLGFLAGGVGRPVLVLMPADFHGWVTEQFGDPSCPPLTSEGIFLVMRVSESGLMCTSSASPYSVWRYYDFRRVQRDGSRSVVPETGWGGGGEIWAVFTSPSTDMAAFFVGSEQQLAGSWAIEPRLLERIPQSTN